MPAGVAVAAGDFVVNHSAVDVVHAPIEADLGKFRRGHHPEGLDVREVVEQQPRDCQCSQVGQSGGLGQVGERTARGDE